MGAKSRPRYKGGKAREGWSSYEGTGRRDFRCTLVTRSRFGKFDSPRRTRRTRRNTGRKPTADCAEERGLSFGFSPRRPRRARRKLKAVWIVGDGRRFRSMQGGWAKGHRGLGFGNFLYALRPLR